MANWTPEQNDAIYTNGSNIIVSAGAGSGKTAVLSERVVETLRRGIHVNELLILTFTRAAADEMKDRIRKKIKKDLSLKEELAYLDSAYITTFDSYALSVLKKYHYLLNISSDIKITDESIVEIKEHEIFDQVFLEMYESNDDNFFKLIDKYCLKNDSVLRENIYSISKTINDFLDRDDYLINLEKNFYNDETFNRLKKELADIIENKKKVVELELDNFSRYFDDDYIVKIESIVNPIIKLDNNERLRDYAGFSLPSVPRGSSDEAKSSKSRLKKELDELVSYGAYFQSELLNSQFNINKSVVLTIINILRKYFERLDRYKNDNNIYTFSDVAKKSIYLLENYEEIRNEIKYSFKEIMIDEYQDTNDVQETFISMISNNNVYMVGDIKQSIYRFRGSNPIIFKNKYDMYSINNGGIKIDLIKNFRSRCEVLESINKLFDLLMDDEIGGANYTLSHEMVYGNKTYDLNKVDNFNYNMEILEYNLDGRTDFSKSEVEIFTIANDIKNKMKSNMKVYDKETECMRNIRYSDFVIILDRSKYFTEYKKIFEYLDIPLEILKDGKLNDNSDLLLIKNIIDFIYLINSRKYDVDFKYDFMSIGRSFLYEYDDDYLFDIITNNKIYETKLYQDFAKISNINSKTAFDLIIEILDITDYYNKLYKIGDYENINVRLETISNLANNMNENGMSFVDLKNYIDEIIEYGIDIKYTMFNNGSDSVKILTIHKSKGLEYPICYFADLDHDFNTMELKNNFIASKKYGIITPLIDLDDDSSFIKEIYKNNFLEEEISEKIRLFYVALTRAREKMIIVIPEKDSIQFEKNINGTIEKVRRLNYKSLGDLIYSTKYYLKNYFRLINIDDLGLTKNYLYNKSLNLILDNNRSDKLEVIDIDIEFNELVNKHFSKNLPSLKEKNEMLNMEFGTYIHELLEYCDIKNPNLDIINDELAKEKIINFINNPLIRGCNGTFYHEYEFIYEDDGDKLHGIIDLLIEENDKIYIIDFKLKNVLDDAYKKQLDGYRKYIQSISNKPIYTYLYSIMDDNLFEV